jgi:hypothetical protein
VDFYIPDQLLIKVFGIRQILGGKNRAYSETSTLTIHRLPEALKGHVA